MAKYSRLMEVEKEYNRTTHQHPAPGVDTT